MTAQNKGIVSSQMMHSITQLSISTDNMLRHQLEDMARRSQRIGFLPPVPELSTPSECSLLDSQRIESSIDSTTTPIKNDLTPPPPLPLSSAPTSVNNPMSTSLFQEFSNRQLRQQG